VNDAPDKWATIDRRLRRFWAAVTVLLFALILVVEPLRGRMSFWAGLAVVAAVMILWALAFVPLVFRGHETFFAFLAAAVAFVVAPRRITQLDFYSTVATIVPVLFLALAFQARTFWIRDEMDETARRLAILVGATLIFAGFECLRVLSLGNAARGDAQLVVTALTGAVAALALTAVTGTAFPTRERETAAPSSQAHVPRSAPVRQADPKVPAGLDSPRRHPGIARSMIAFGVAAVGGVAAAGAWAARRRL